MKKIVVLGSGLVAGPLLNYLLSQTDHEVVCATQDLKRAHELIGDYPKGSACDLDVNNTEALEDIIKHVDIVISLLPYIFHVAVAKVCIKYKKNMITASYVSDEMRKLDEAAKKAGIVILNEIGLDPGIDHMSAMRIIHNVQKSGGKIVAFESYCGGLPSPRSDNNPLRYKFSWSPRGVLMAGRNSAQYLKEEKVVKIDGAKLFESNWTFDVGDIGTFEVYPNRNALPYIEAYGLDHLQTMFRGTFRYPGWCSFWAKMSPLGWLEESKEKLTIGQSWASVMRKLIPGNGDLLSDLCKYWNVAEDSSEIETANWIGLLSEDMKIETEGSLLDVLCTLLTDKLKYKSDETDMTLLHHEFIAEFDDRNEFITSTMVDYGVPNGDSSMSRTVSLPVAIAARNIVEGNFGQLSGVIIPVLPEIYNPVLDELEEIGIKCIETFEEC